jgi:excisionase family DNA binding protein
VDADTALRSAGPGPASDARDYYSISQAAALLGVSRVSIWRWIRAGRLPAARLGHRTTRIKRRDLERLLGEGRTAVARSWAMRDLGTEVAPRADWRVMGAREHFVQFYEADAFLLEAVGEYIGATLRAGDAAIVIATPPHRAAIEKRLAAHGLDVAGARACGRYVALDAAATLARIMVDGAPDPGRFREVVGDVIAHATEGRRRVRIFGEMVALLAGAGNHAAVTRLEELWNDLQRTHSFALFCAYPMECLDGEAGAALLNDVCEQHSGIIPAESYTALPSPDDRLRAITVLQQQARSLEAVLAAEWAARVAAEDALRVRDEFLSIAAHELRTPITSLSGQAQLLLRRLRRHGRLEPEQLASALETIRGQAEKLSRLVSQLLDLSRLEGGKLALERHPTDLVDVVQQVVATARAWSERHTISVAAPPSLEAWVDPLRLEQVLTNLLDNAVKYSPEGGPIEVALARVDAGSVELSVRDRGLGIPVEKRGQLFERFYQAHANGHRGGMGLGLYVSRQIVKLHGGDICAEFPPEGGTRFVVRLPLAPHESEPAGTAAGARDVPAEQTLS